MQNKLRALVNERDRLSVSWTRKNDKLCSTSYVNQGLKDGFLSVMNLLFALLLRNFILSQIRYPNFWYLSQRCHIFKGKKTIKTGWRFILSAGLTKTNENFLHVIVHHMVINRKSSLSADMIPHASEWKFCESGRINKADKKRSTLKVQCNLLERKPRIKVKLKRCTASVIQTPKETRSDGQIVFQWGTELSQW